MAKSQTFTPKSMIAPRLESLNSHTIIGRWWDLPHCAIQFKFPWVFWVGCLIRCAAAGAAAPLPSDGKSHQFSAAEGQLGSSTVPFGKNLLAVPMPGLWSGPEMFT
jgi:hypothetical protein